VEVFARVRVHAYVNTYSTYVYINWHILISGGAVWGGVLLRVRACT
jgi:hypothetical protein